MLKNLFVGLLGAAILILVEAAPAENTSAEIGPVDTGAIGPRRIPHLKPKAYNMQGMSPDYWESRPQTGVNVGDLKELLKEMNKKNEGYRRGYRRGHYRRYRGHRNNRRHHRKNTGLVDTMAKVALTPFSLAFGGNVWDSHSDSSSSDSDDSRSDSRYHH